MNNKLILRINRNKIDIFALCCFVFLPSLNNFFNSFVIKGLGLSEFSITPFIYIFMALLGIRAIITYVLTNRVALFIFAFLIFGILASYIMYPAIRSIIYTQFYDLVYNPVNKVIFFCFPAAMYALHIKEYDSLFDAFVSWSRVTVVLGVCTYTFVNLIVGQTLQYMVFSYFMLTSICICSESFAKNKNLIDFLLVAVGSVAVVFCGARGAVISLAVYLVVRYFLFNEKWKLGVRIIVCLILAIVTAFLYFNLTQILTPLQHFLTGVGIDSRIITSILEGALTESDGRNSISSAIFNGLAKNPVGFGFFGDRYVTGTFGYFTYTYSHNIFYEILCTFGIILGPILIVFFAHHFIKTLILKYDPSFHSIFYALIPYGLFQLFFTSSVLENIVFYVLCGFIIATGIRRRKRLFNERICEENV